MAREKMIQVRLSEEEHANAAKQAADGGFETISQYVRACLRRGGPQAWAPYTLTPDQRVVDGEEQIAITNEPQAEAARKRVQARRESAVPCSRAARHKPGVRCGYCGVTP